MGGEFALSRFECWSVCNPFVLKPLCPQCLRIYPAKKELPFNRKQFSLSVCINGGFVDPPLSTYYQSGTWAELILCDNFVADFPFGLGGSMRRTSPPRESPADASKAYTTETFCQLAGQHHRDLLSIGRPTPDPMTFGS